GPPGASGVDCNLPQRQLTSIGAAAYRLYRNGNGGSVRKNPQARQRAPAEAMLRRGCHRSYPEPRRRTEYWLCPLLPLQEMAPGPRPALTCGGHRGPGGQATKNPWG